MADKNGAAKPGVALITGASSGIGLDLARCFARDRHTILISARDEDKLGKAVAELESLGAPRVEPISVDLAQPEGAPRLYEKAQEIGLDIDHLALNAGVGVWGDFVRETDLYEELRMIQLNVVSTVQAAKLFLPAMVERGSGGVLITASLSAIGPAPKLAVYSATKAFLYAFAESIRNEIADTGVTVSALLPDITDTNFFRRAGAQESQTIDAKKGDPAVVAKAGYAALMKGEDHVVTPGASKVKAAIANILPERLVAHLARAD